MQFDFAYFLILNFSFWDAVVSFERGCLNFNIQIIDKYENKEV